MTSSTPRTPPRQFLVVTPLTPLFACTVYGDVLTDGTVNCWHDPTLTQWAGQFREFELQETELLSDDP